MSKLFCVVILFAGCKEKTPPKQEPVTQPSPDPSPAARKPELPKPDPVVVPEKGSGDGSGGAKPTAGDGTIQRKNADVEAAMAPPGKLTEKLKQRAAEKKAADANKK